eukprot:11870363-Alexandrium_andersonii.AAC.1
MGPHPLPHVAQVAPGRAEGQGRGRGRALQERALRRPRRCPAPGHPSALAQRGEPVRQSGGLCPAQGQGQPDGAAVPDKGQVLLGERLLGSGRGRFAQGHGHRDPPCGHARGPAHWGSQPQ